MKVLWLRVSAAGRPPWAAAMLQDTTHWVVASMGRLPSARARCCSRRTLAACRPCWLTYSTAWAGPAACDGSSIAAQGWWVGRWVGRWVQWLLAAGCLLPRGAAL